MPSFGGTAYVTNPGKRHWQPVFLSEQRICEERSLGPAEVEERAGSHCHAWQALAPSSCVSGLKEVGRVALMKVQGACFAGLGEEERKKNAGVCHCIACVIS